MQIELKLDNKEFKKARNVLKQLPVQMRLKTGRFALKKAAKFYEQQVDRGIARSRSSLRRSFAVVRKDKGYFEGRLINGINYKVSAQSASGSRYSFMWFEYGTLNRYTKRGKFLGKIRPHNIVKKVLKKKSNARKARNIYKLEITRHLGRMVKRAAAGR